MDEAQKHFSEFHGLKEVWYLYVDADKVVDMVEFRIDDCEEFIYLIKGTHDGGFISVRFLGVKRLVIIICHDECVKAIHFSSKSWTGPYGETLLVPKDEGMGIIISYFQSR